MDSEDLVNLTVLIAGRPYPLKVRRAEQMTITAIAKEVNDKISHYQITYKNKDKQDCLSMAAMTYAVDLQRSQLAMNRYNSIDSKLLELEDLLDQLLD